MLADVRQAFVSDEGLRRFTAKELSSQRRSAWFVSRARAASGQRQSPLALLRPDEVTPGRMRKTLIGRARKMLDVLASRVILEALEGRIGVFLHIQLPPEAAVARPDAPVWSLLRVFSKIRHSVRERLRRRGVKVSYWYWIHEPLPSGLPHHHGLVMVEPHHAEAVLSAYVEVTRGVLKRLTGQDAPLGVVVRSEKLVGLQGALRVLQERTARRGQSGQIPAPSTMMERRFPGVIGYAAKSLLRGKPDFQRKGRRYDGVGRWSTVKSVWCDAVTAGAWAWLNGVRPRWLVAARRRDLFFHLRDLPRNDKEALAQAAAVDTYLKEHGGTLVGGSAILEKVEKARQLMQLDPSGPWPGQVDESVRPIVSRLVSLSESGDPAREGQGSGGDADEVVLDALNDVEIGRALKEGEALLGRRLARRPTPGKPGLRVLVSEASSARCRPADVWRGRQLVFQSSRTFASHGRTGRPAPPITSPPALGGRGRDRG